MSDLETQDTVPLSPDAQRIVELERRVRELETFIAAHPFTGRELQRRQQLLDQQAPVMKAALIVGRHWNDQDGVNAQYIDALADAVAAFDALQPKG